MISGVIEERGYKSWLVTMLTIINRCYPIIFDISKWRDLPDTVNKDESMIYVFRMPRMSIHI